MKKYTKPKIEIIIGDCENNLLFNTSIQNNCRCWDWNPFMFPKPCKCPPGHCHCYNHHHYQSKSDYFIDEDSIF